MMPKIWMFKLVLMLILNGCSFLGIDLTETRTIAISKPPYTIALDGDLEQKDLDKAYRMLEFLATQKLEGTVNPNFTVHITDQTVVVKGTRLTEEIKVQKNIDVVTDPQGYTE